MQRRKGDAIKLRHNLATMAESVALRRRQLQPPANAGMRGKFNPPANRPRKA